MRTIGSVAISCMTATLQGVGMMEPSDRLIIKHTIRLIGLNYSGQIQFPEPVLVHARYRGMGKRVTSETLILIETSEGLLKVEYLRARDQQLLFGFFPESRDDTRTLADQTAAIFARHGITLTFDPIP